MPDRPMIRLQPKEHRGEPHLRCPLCADEGLPARVLALHPATNEATVQLEGAERAIALDLVDGVRPGDFVLVHLDMAIAKLDAADVVADMVAE